MILEQPVATAVPATSGRYQATETVGQRGAVMDRVPGDVHVPRRGAEFRCQVSGRARVDHHVRQRPKEPESANFHVRAEERCLLSLQQIQTAHVRCTYSNTYSLREYSHCNCCTYR